MASTRTATGAPLLAIIPNVGMASDGERVFLDTKAAQGLALYAAHWPGPVRCIGRAADPADNPYGTWQRRNALPFEVAVLSADAPIADALPYLQDAACIVAGADDHRDRPLPGLVAKPIVMTIEYTLRTRLDIVRVGAQPWHRKLRTALWLLKQEKPLRRALAAAAGLQANGTPAFSAYAGLNRAPFLFFDTRLPQADFIGLAEAEAKAGAVAASTRPLRLAFSGRLERMKGADRLVPILRALAAKGCTATLDIYGQGSLVPVIAAEAARHGLSERVRMHGAVDFETSLMPTLRREIDLFVCPHPQADPSCTYLETLGCGVPIVGFRNEAFAGVLDLGPCGVGVPVGDVEAAAVAITALDRDRQRLAALTRGAAEVAASRLFEGTLAARVAHLRQVAGA